MDKVITYDIVKTEELVDHPYCAVERINGKVSQALYFASEYDALQVIAAWESKQEAN